MSDVAFAVIISGVVTLLTAWLTARSSRKAATETTNLKNRQVDADAYRLAREIEAGVVQGLRDELERLNTELATGRAALTTEQVDNARLRDTVHELERTRDRLLRILRAADLEVPVDIYGPNPANPPVP